MSLSLKRIKYRHESLSLGRHERCLRNIPLDNCVWETTSKKPAAFKELTSSSSDHKRPRLKTFLQENLRYFRKQGRRSRRGRVHIIVYKNTIADEAHQKRQRKTLSWKSLSNSVSLPENRLFSRKWWHNRLWVFEDGKSSAYKTTCRSTKFSTKDSLCPRQVLRES